MGLFKTSALSVLAVAPLSTSASAAEFSATNCEAFVDRVVIQQDSHASYQAYFYIKTHAEMRGDGVRVSKVSFSGAADPASSFVGSEDYFVLMIPNLGGDYSHTTAEGSFSVDLTNGDRLWINAGNVPARDFVFDDLVNRLGRYAGGGYERRTMTSVFYGSRANISSVIQTADYETDLAEIFNAKRCR